MTKKYILIPVILLLATVSAVLVFGSAPEMDDSGNHLITPTVTSAATSEEEFKWYSVTDALQMNKLSGKKIFIDTYTTWCGPCKMLEANTFSNPTIRKLLDEYFIPAKFNAESGDTINFNGKTYTNPKYSPQPRQSTHPFAIYIASTQNGLGYPTMVFLDGNLNRIDAIAGYLTPTQLEPILVYYGSGINASTDWPTFLSTFKSEITQ